MTTAREYAEEEAQAVKENADICPELEDFDSDDDASGDAPVLTTSKAKEAELEASTAVSDQTEIFQACAEKDNDGWQPMHCALNLVREE
jgi:hypothetical protein